MKQLIEELKEIGEELGLVVMINYDLGTDSLWGAIVDRQYTIYYHGVRWLINSLKQNKIKQWRRSIREEFFHDAKQYADELEHTYQVSEEATICQHLTK